MTNPAFEHDDHLTPNAGSALSRAQMEEALRRLEQALEYEGDDPTDHARCRKAMPDMAAAELEGRRVARLFPLEYAHLDACEECGLEYGELLDTLLALESGSLTTTEPPPPLPKSLLTIMRIRGWMERTAKRVLEKAQIGSDSIEMIFGMLLEQLRDLPVTPAPLQVQQSLLGFGGEDEETPVLLATWYATQQVAEQYSAAELRTLAENKALVKQARTIAKQTAQQLRLSRKLRNAFVEQFARSVEDDPAAFVQLGRPDEEA